MADVILTKEGLKELEDRLEYLKSVKRREIAEEIKIAREQGDLSENAEYDAARDEQSRIEGEIKDIEEKLKNVKIIEETGDSSTVSIGCTVTILDIEENEKLVYQIVGTTESDIVNGKISNESPIGHALLGKKVGATAVAQTPGGEVRVKVLKISR